MAWPFSDSNGSDFAAMLNPTGAAFQAPATPQLNLNAALTGFGGLGGTNDGTPATTGGLFSALGNLFSKDALFGSTNDKGVTSMGWAPAALGIGQSIFGALQGQKAMALAKDQLSEQKRQFDLNFGAQRQSMNTELEDRQRARVASNPNAYESVSDYMNKNRIK